MPRWVSRCALQGYILLTKGVANMALYIGLNTYCSVIASNYVDYLADHN